MPSETHIYSTESIRPDQRFDFWRDVICDAYLPITCTTPNRSEFHGQISLTRLPRLNLSRVSGSPQHVRRSRSEIGRDRGAYFMISLQLSGTGAVVQAGREAVLAAGDFAAYSTIEPYEIRCETPVDQLILQVPRSAMLARLPQADLLTARRIQSTDGLGGMLSSQIRQSADLVAEQSELVQQHMRDLMIDYVATGLSSLAPSSLELSRPEHLLLNRAKAFVKANLRDHDLSRDSLARAMGMSARNLSRVFAREGQSIAGFIRAARLEAIALDLADPRLLRMSVTEIALRWGMSNAQHLSRLFKETYGVSPRAYRVEQQKMQ
ncbi:MULTISPECIES: helix-turn-helix domain-containing protein [unclassified Ruegeria]|uniref:AraC-like ligand-binding domain-containing protein n=1 Tax=unclassified Ruegeria TaxID=2625375 RepID=UPI001489DB57|nr:MULTISPECIES: helix-turn-helix domain-containing protein [unclassified Ruegeria]